MPAGATATRFGRTPSTAGAAWPSVIAASARVPVNGMRSSAHTNVELPVAWDSMRPGSRFIGGSPTRRATRTLAGRRHSSSGVAICSMRPASMTATRSATDSASIASGVHQSVGDGRDVTMRRISERSLWRSLASRWEIGSSSSVTAGLWTRVRASATRCFWPPDNSAGNRALRWRISRTSSKASTTPMSVPRALGATRGDITFSRTVRCG